MLIAYKIYEFFKNGVLGIKKDFSEVVNNLSEEPEFFKNNKDFFNPDIPNNHLVVVEHRGLKLIGKVHNYEMGNLLSSKICYFTEELSKPAVLISKKNLSYIIGDARPFVLENQDILFRIAKTIKSKSIMTLLNVYKVLKTDGHLDSLTDKKIKAAYKVYQFRINLIANSWMTS
jgi:hypothetical protein